MPVLHTLGRVYLEGDDGTPMTGAAAQRRLLALLSVLAVAGDGGVSRDRLLTLFWPEGDPERARHALTQTVYNARRALGSQDILASGPADVRLNTALLASDVRSLEHAIAMGDDERAAALYRGPFLDGFFLSGSTEFEQWASTQRDRFAEAMRRVFERLAESSERAGEMRRAVEWRRRVTGLDPYASDAALRLMRALVAAGDRAGALQHARVHELMLREQLDTSADPEVAAFATRLRAEAATPVAAERTEGRPPAIAGASPVHAGPGVVEGGPTPDVGAVIEPIPPAAKSEASFAASTAIAARPRAGGGRLVAAAIGIVAIAGVLVLAFVTRTRPRPLGAAPIAPGVVMVAPFRVSGADPSLAYLREGMVELLGARLADVDATRSLDPGAVLSAWRRADISPAGEMPRADAVTLAGRLGAAKVVVGSIIGDAGRLVLSASLLAVPSGAVEAQESIEGSADSLTTLVDRLAARLLAAEAGERDRLATHTTPAVGALRAFLDGQAAYRRGDHAAAMSAYERALRIDSTFALAALQLALAADRLNDAEQHDRALALAWAARDELSERDRAHLTAFAGPRFPAPSSEAEQLAAWERAAALAPDRADVWHELGERFFHSGGVLGYGRAFERAVAAFRRALELDPAYEPSRRLLILSAARMGDSTTLARLATPRALRDSLGELAPFLRWRVALARGDRVELRHMRDTLPQLPASNLRAIAMTSLFDGVGVEDADRALRIRRALARRAADQLDAVLAQHAAALNEGHPVLALDLTEQLQELQPGMRAHLRLRVLDALYAEGDQAAARAAVQELVDAAGASAVGTRSSRAVQVADVCVVAQWQLRQGDLAAARRAVVRLRREAVLPDLVPVAAPPLACAELLAASIAVQAGERDALRAVQGLDSLMLSGPAISDAGTYAPLVVARLYERLGRPQQALEAIRRRAYLTGWPRYLATMRREEGRLAESLGDRTGARLAYRRYLALRRSPESAVAPEVLAVRAAAARLEP